MKVNLVEKFSLFQDHWNPRIVGELNGQHVKIAKVKGTFPWHHHEQEDELFMVVKGSLTIHFREHKEVLKSGEFLIVPKGVEHQPEAEEEAHILLFEPVGTLNTGSSENEFTVKDLEDI